MPEHPTDAHFSFSFVFKQALNFDVNIVALADKTKAQTFAIRLLAHHKP